MNPHWLVIYRKQWIKLTNTKQEAVDFCKVRFWLSTILTNKLRTASVVRIPRRGLIEINCCDCTDGLHEDELKGIDV